MPLARSLVIGTLTLTTSVAGFALLAGPASAAAATRYVALTGADDRNDCTVASKPCATIQHAFDVAADGDTVSIGKGTFHQFAATGRSLTVQGASGGTTIVDGAGGQDGASLTFRGAEDAQPTVTVRDISLSGSAGLGLLVDTAKVAVVDSHLDRNKAGGVYALGATVTVTGSTASGNVGTGTVPGIGFPAGVGALGLDSSLAFDHTNLDGNSAGGVVALGTSLSLVDSTASRNATGDQQTGFAFGIVAFSAPVEITRSTVADNGVGGIIAEGDVGIGAAPQAAAAPSVTVADSTVSGNTQVGVVAEGGASLDLATSTVSGNGIGVYASQSAATVRNSTIAATENHDFGDGSGNLASAGLYYENLSTNDARIAASPTFLPRLNSVRFGARKLAVSAPAQRRAAAAPTDGITVSGSVLDQTGTVPDCSSSSAIIDAGYNLSADAKNSCAFTAAKHDQVKTAASLGALADNGGPTLTQLPARGSAALDVIPAGQAGCVAGATDQRGITRPQGARCDVGAVERVLDPVRITTKSLPDGQVGEQYRKTLAATGGDGDYAWTLADGSSLPAGLSLSRTGVISGTPTKAGKYTVTVLADGASRRYTLEIAAVAAGPNDNGADPIAETGAPSAQLTAWGAALVLLGLAALVLAGHIGRRPGRHRNA